METGAATEETPVAEMSKEESATRFVQAFDEQLEKLDDESPNVLDLHCLREDLNTHKDFAHSLAEHLRGRANADWREVTVGAARGSRVVRKANLMAKGTLAPHETSVIYFAQNPIDTKAYAIDKPGCIAGTSVESGLGGEKTLYYAGASLIVTDRGSLGIPEPTYNALIELFKEETTNSTEY